MKDTSKAEKIYRDMINHPESKKYFVGVETTGDYLGYVLGDVFKFICVTECETYENDAYYVLDNVTSASDKKSNIGENMISLSDFVEVLNTSAIPSDRKIALWGGGYELDNEFDLIMKYCKPEFIIDKSKTGNYRGIKYIHPDDVEFNDYFIIITTTKYASDIKGILNASGCEEGKDYILGSNPCLLNDSSEMFIKTLTDHPIKKVNCCRPFEYVNVGVGGNLTHCCFQWLPKYIGNIAEKSGGYDSIISRIIRVSFMNCTYSFCNSICCPLMIKEREKLWADKSIDEDVYLKEQEIKEVDLAFDNTCNLYCESCRKDFIIDKSGEPLEIAKYVEDNLMPRAKKMTIAGNGEVFLSKAYQSLLNREYPDLQMVILSNGNLFTEEKWKLLEGKYKSIYLTFSIDAASKITYEKVRRGGKWENLMRGLKLASDLKNKGAVEKFVMRFVVSRQNYMEMPDFVKLGLDLGCDCVNFSRIENWGTFTESEFDSMSMFIGDSPKPEMRKILELPIMQNEIVSYSNIAI